MIDLRAGRLKPPCPSFTVSICGVPRNARRQNSARNTIARIPPFARPPSYFQSASQLRGVFHGTGGKHKVDSAGSVPSDNLLCAFKPDARLPFIYLNPQRFPRIHNFIVKGKPFFAAAVVLPRAARPLQCLQRGNGQNGVCMYERARPVEMIERKVNFFLFVSNTVKFASSGLQIACAAV